MKIEERGWEGERERKGGEGRRVLTHKQTVKTPVPVLKRLHKDVLCLVYNQWVGGRKRQQLCRVSLQLGEEWPWRSGRRQGADTAPSAYGVECGGVSSVEECLVWGVSGVEVCLVWGMSGVCMCGIAHHADT